MQGGTQIGRDEIGTSKEITSIATAQGEYCGSAKDSQQITTTSNSAASAPQVKLCHNVVFQDVFLTYCHMLSRNRNVLPLFYFTERGKRRHPCSEVNLHQAEVAVYTLRHLAWYFLLRLVEILFLVQECLRIW